jgi:hypothetical protein
MTRWAAGYGMQRLIRPDRVPLRWLARMQTADGFMAVWVAASYHQSLNNEVSTTS